MSQLAPQPDHAAVVIQELLEWVPKHCINGTNGPSAAPNHPFMPLPDLEAYLKAHNRTSKLLRAIYPEREHPVTVPSLEESYIRVFTILILIGKGRYIEYVLRYSNLRDSRLPFLQELAHFPIDPNDPTFRRSFYEKQFAFSPHCFYYNENLIMLEDLCILPITSKEVLGRSGSAAIYKIKLHDYYDQLSLAAETTTQSYDARPANTYVLKVYETKDANNYYENEVKAFKRLAIKQGADQGFIQLLGSFQQGETHNLLLEYADCGTLEDFFQKVPPPSVGEDILLFWERLFNVLKALLRIHATERPDGFPGPDILTGWHQDVRPGNILVLSGKSHNPYDVEFRLAALGLTHFKRTVEMDRQIPGWDIGGTKDYDAPECHRGKEYLEQSKANGTLSVDIWSFGGVCSEAAVWVVLGLLGLNEYRDQRQQEVQGNSNLQDGSSFHDGRKVLRTVKAVHNRLSKTEVRPGHHITKYVLDEMVTEMLEEDPEVRPNAMWLWKKSRKLLNEARLELEESRQPQSPRRTDSAFDQSQSLGQDLPAAPPHTSNNIVHPFSENADAYGPPPNLPQYSSNLQISGPPSSGKGTSEIRSDAWNEHATRTDMTPQVTTAMKPGETSLNAPSKPPHAAPTANATATEPPTSKTKLEKPHLSYEVARQIRDARGVLPHDQQNLLIDLKDRDHVFLMDDSLSMKEHWDDVILLFSVFAYFAKRLDDDGLEMSFTVSDHTEVFKKTSRAVSHLKTMRPSTPSNIDLRLGKILWRYQTDLERQRERTGSFWPREKHVKPLSLYIFTDAAWPGCDAVAPVEAMIEKQKQLGLPKEQVGIQFIRFGNDPIGIERLRYLDFGLRRKYGKRYDIVDSEPFPHGDLLKMLLGAIWHWFDDDDDDEADVGD